MVLCSKIKKNIMINVLITADFCPNERVVDLIKNQDIDSIFNDLQDEIKFSDFAITNLECPILLDSKDISKIKKVGPSLSTTNNAASILKASGFNLLTLANNHIMDYGVIGLNQTIEAVKNNDLLYVGAGETLEKARKYIVISKNDISIGIINVTENEFSTASEQSPGANPLDIIKNHYDIVKCKKECDKVIVIYHGGHEGYQYPSPRIKELFHYYVDSGADAIICHHAHCFSGYEIYNEKPIFYGLGNFVFDWKDIRNNIWNYGYAVRLFLNSSKLIDFEIIPYEQGNDLPGVVKLKGEKLNTFHERLDEVNKIIANDEFLEKEFLKLSISRNMEYLSTFQPYSNRILNGLYKRGFLPSLLSQQKKRRILNTIRCESHRDLLLQTLKRDIK